MNMILMAWHINIMLKLFLSVVCVVSDISGDKLKVPLDVFIILALPHIGRAPYTLAIRGRGQVGVQPRINIFET